MKVTTESWKTILHYDQGRRSDRKAKMNHDQDTVLFELTFNEQGDVKLRLVDPPAEPDELVFTSLEEGQPAIRRPVSEEVKNWLKTTRPVMLDDLQGIMASSPLPPDPATISLLNSTPLETPRKPDLSAPG
jgi:hypothetical protein